MNPRHRAVRLLAGLVLTSRLAASQAADIVQLADAQCAVSVSPATLETTLSLPDGSQVSVSCVVEGLGAAGEVTRNASRAHWDYPDRATSVVMELLDGDLWTTISASKPGSCTWPVVDAGHDARALIWPRAEGAYVPLNDTTWTACLAGQEWDTLEGLSMPFWAVEGPGCTVTYIATNPFNNTITFTETSAGLALVFAHEFPPNHAAREYGFVVSAGPGRSPVEPALAYRKYLKTRGAFVPMAEKLRRTPAAERLLGAAHVYLWGDSFLSRHDVKNPERPKARMWGPFCARIVAESSGSATMGARLKALMTAEAWKQVEAAAKTEWPDKFMTGQIADELSRILARPDFHVGAVMTAGSQTDQDRRLMQADPASLSGAQLHRRNGLLLRATYPDCLLPVELWGDGVSLKMLDALKVAGLDRLKLCVPGWEGLEIRPDVARRAADMGYLLGTYDSYHSIHDPKLKGTDATWATAQFDAALYETGAILRSDGTPRRGFKQAGYKLSPLAARPYVERRVNERMERVPYSYYFVDCDGFGEVYDDYSPLHPATQAEDAAARADRLAWLSRQHGLVVGTEGGAAYAAPAIHVAEGIVTPVFGWGDPDMHDKAGKSPYYLGAYYPPDGPRVFLQQVPVKAEYQYLFYDPRFRLPLYETVFHDSVVATHHWSAPSAKFAGTTGTVRLTELLYQVPPMVHLNLDELAARGKEIRAHTDAWSPLHRRLGFAAMTGFGWLTPDRLVQWTEFADGTRITANFGSAMCDDGATRVPAGAVLVVSRDEALHGVRQVR